MTSSRPLSSRASHTRLVGIALTALALLGGSETALANGHGQWHGGGHHWHGGGARVHPAWRGGYMLPPLARTILWAGVTYAVIDGIWYASGPNGYATVMPPAGIIVNDLPMSRTVVMINGIPHYLVNGVTYRERLEGGFEVIQAAPVVVPGSASGGAPAPTVPSTSREDRQYVYPRNGQSAGKQSNDEFDCHRWAASQASFDPTTVATGQANSVYGATNAPDAQHRNDYLRARAACLEGRGYTVR